ncbi:PAS domain S-box-containing protein [Amycolatopsis bartoniae]|uniref:histidine kinase n=1 Tax=Amycolatopsis bartoniae TaxID=941986 RepID=A0A8H9M6H8_9PSEU|nr:SpoIIE family protein phosphatase [Amycolatopsis bartoniae]MBB2939007.1 PAS domain S-box-containing protein [Amycolatopsis bartoniae]TVT04262.1 SpoIIE family protein phosphatase [Amycolatopsis bartoniae]GHF65629.1 histidine kinase [Amycolatopsis bartoniae]
MSGGPDALFPGASRMAARMRNFAWGDSPFGAPETWPAALRTAVRICLTSRFPMIIWWGEELRFLYNDAYLPLLGTKHPALGKPGERVWTEIWHIIGPMLDGVMSTGEATWSEDLLLPMNRHGYWEETYWTYSYSPLHDDDGTVRGVFTAVSETTERVIGERRLARLRELGAHAGTAKTVPEACALVAEVLRGAAEDVPYAAIHLCGENGELELVAATGPAPRPRPDGPGGWPLAEVLGDGEPRLVTDVAERFGDLPAGGWTAPPGEAAVLPLQGETGADTVGVMVLAASSRRALDESYRTFLGLVAQQSAALINSAVAYQEQQRRAEELVALDEAKTRFFANISHEFRTPLTLILGPVGELRERLADESLREEVEVIHRNGLRLGKLVNNLLDFSRIEAGRMQARYEPVDLAGFTAELASLFRAAVEKAGLGFEVDCRPLSGPVFADRGMWEKVVLNLLSNAVKYTFDGDIRVVVGEADGEAVVTIADTGIGIAANELPRLFERFHRIPSVRARSNEGSGIGLALVRELVHLHGGTITAESTPGAGTVFTVRLPFGSAHLPAQQVVSTATADGVTAETADPFVQEALRWLPDGTAETGENGEAAAPHPGERRPHVLVADDNADMRDYLVRLLRPRYRVQAVADGKAALAAALREPPDLLVSDVMMPGLDGLGLLSALRADSRTAGVPMLLLSARAGQEAAIEGLAAGADDYLVKPFSARELLARVRSTVELARVRTQHTRWRAALIDSLQEGFFVSDADGAVVEVNAAFGDLLGFGPEGVPYEPEHPWWPDPQQDPAAYAEVRGSFALTRTEPSGSFVLPLRHRDGHRVWAALNFNAVYDDQARRRVVGTIRDVTAERYTVQRESALSELSQRLARAAGEPDVVQQALEFLRDLWGARRVLAATWRDGKAPDVVSTENRATYWHELPEPLRRTIADLRALPPLHAGNSFEPKGNPGAGTTVDHPDGQLAIWVEPDPARPLGAQDETLLVLLCGTLAQALRRAHVADQQRAVALALQRSVLGPAQLPPGFAVRYEPATPPLEVGGDWYDVVPLPDGRTGIVVGDCVGRGLPAAAVMGQLRSACRALLLEAGSPRHTLTALDRFADQVPGAACTTVFCGVLDPETGTLTYSSGGHPPGILVDAAGAVRCLEQGNGVPLAVGTDVARQETKVVVPSGGVLLLYTDGLVERRRQPLDVGIDRAAEVAREGRAEDLEDLASRLMRSLQPDAGYDDDVALLLYRRSIPDFAGTWHADPENLAPMRGALREWCLGAGLDRHLAQDVLVAVGEAVTNSIEHAYPGRTADVGLTARLSEGRLTVVVTDTGRWRIPPPDNHVLRGRGLDMMRALAQEVVVDTSDTGTIVTLQWRTR